MYRAAVLCGSLQRDTFCLHYSAANFKISALCRSLRVLAVTPCATVVVQRNFFLRCSTLKSPMSVSLSGCIDMRKMFSVVTGWSSPWPSRDVLYGQPLYATVNDK